ncbi:hypothetical protein BN927_01167 [Lactococcus lactis subsp. lactis Dephy 1]|uniref:hypothetical protein n=1 Tax=Lactococcus lactis TaxID=1358 RepID=UPI0003B89BF1|nr:hypothetical protein [Lactococcus lactis]CDI47765.1 hypothetical protein BN927_01167 [Lactococcus lactis subsp. lactis Dephy 1]
MKKLATGLVGLATLLLILSGCTKKPEPSKTNSSTEKVKTSQSSTSSSKTKVTLTDKELVAATYVESYMAQHSVKDIPTAVNDILKQPQFMISSTGGYFLANQEPVLVNGDLGIQSTITDDKIHVQSYNGNEHFSDKYYSAKELTSKYNTHVELLKKVVAISDKHIAELNSLTDEELALAAYVRNYATTDVEIRGYLSGGLADNDFSVEFQDNSYRFGQGTASSTEEITVSGNQVMCVIHDGATETKTVNYTKEELTKLFVQYKKLLDVKLELGKQNSAKASTSSTVDTTKLTEDQAKTWVKNYLVQSGVVDQDAIDNRTSVSTYLDDNNYLCLEPRASAKDNTTNDSTLGYFRINDAGELQQQNTDGDWQTVSTSYLG